MLLNYDDIVLQPDYSRVPSRGDVITMQGLGDWIFALPVVPANMKAVISREMCQYLAENNYFYIYHRFDNDTVDFCKHMKSLGLYLSISVGVNKDSDKVLDELSALGITPEYITIDIAHGHSLKMAEMIVLIKAIFPDSFLIAGNVCTEEGTNFLVNLGADAIKVGIAGGSVCTTRYKTGFGCPQFSAVERCVGAARGVPVIADGGIEHNGDIAKALVAGARFVMAGKLFAGLKDSPGDVSVIDGVCYTTYYGSASRDNKGHNNNIEGTVKLLPVSNMGLSEKLKEIKQDLQSSISYSGGFDIYYLKFCKYEVVK